MILLNVRFDKSVLESLFHNKTYTSADGSVRQQYVIDKRIYPAELFDAPIFTFINCKPDSRTAYVLKISIGPRLKISRFSAAEGGLAKMQINAMVDVKHTAPQLTLYLAKTGLPLKPDQAAHFRQDYKWGYACQLLSQPDKTIAYLYAAPSAIAAIECATCKHILPCKLNEKPSETARKADWHEEKRRIKGMEETYYLCPRCQNK